MATAFLLLIYLSFISLGLPDTLLGASWPAMRLDLGAAVGDAGYISLIITCGTITSSLLSTRLVRRFGTGKVTAVSVLATAAALMLSAPATSVWWLMLTAIPLGLGAGAVDAGLNNYVALHYEPRHMSWLHSFWGLGALVGPIVIGAYLRFTGGWRGGYVTISIVQFVVAGLLLLSLPQWKKREKFGKAADGDDGAGGEIPRAADVIRISGVAPALFTFVFYCAVEVGVGLWGASYLVGAKGFEADTAATALSLYYGGITVGRMVSGFLTVRLRGQQLIRLGGVLVVLAAILLVLPLPPAASPVAMALIGLGLAPIFPCMLQLTPERFGAGNSPTIIGWQMASAYFGSTVTPPLIGQLLGRAGMWLLPPAILLLGALLYGFTELTNYCVYRKEHAK